MCVAKVPKNCQIMDINSQMHCWKRWNKRRSILTLNLLSAKSDQKLELETQKFLNPQRLFKNSTCEATKISPVWVVKHLISIEAVTSIYIRSLAYATNDNFVCKESFHSTIGSVWELQLGIQTANEMRVIWYYISWYKW